MNNFLFISFDVAIKSLATSILYIYKDNSINENMEGTSSPRTPQMSHIQPSDNDTKYSINILYLDVVDLLKEKTTRNISYDDELLINIRLKTYLDKCELFIQNFIDNIDTSDTTNDFIFYCLIENQMKQNIKSHVIQKLISYHFTNNKFNYIIKFITPSLKNKICFNDNMKHIVFLNKYMNNYTANKNHTKTNFLYYLKQNNLLELLNNIKKKNYDDISDSFIQAIAYIYLNLKLSFNNINIF